MNIECSICEGKKTVFAGLSWSPTRHDPDATSDLSAWCTHCEGEGHIFIDTDDREVATRYAHRPDFMCWSAFSEDDDAECPEGCVGRGPTEELAVRNYLAQVSEMEASEIEANAYAEERWRCGERP